MHSNEDLESFIPECMKPRKWFAALQEAEPWGWRNT